MERRQPVKSKRIKMLKTLTAIKAEGIIFKNTGNSISNITRTDPKDVTFIINNQEISAHKDILAFSCDFFYTMFNSNFKEANQDRINITCINYECLKAFIEYFYTSTLNITEINVQDYLIGSSMLLLKDVQEACVNYTKEIINPDNCIKIKNIALSLDLNTFYSFCLTFLINNFRFITNKEDLMTISYDEMILILKSDDLFEKEDKIYDIVMQWVKHDSTTRTKYSNELLWYIRLPSIYHSYQRASGIDFIRANNNNDPSFFRNMYRNPYRKGVLIISHYPIASLPEWYDTASNKWQTCQFINYQIKPPRHLCTCILLHDGRLFIAGGILHDKGSKSTNIFHAGTNTWIALPNMIYERVSPYIVQIGSKVFVAGGITTRISTLSAIECYDLDTNRWSGLRIKNKNIILRKNALFTNNNGLIYFVGFYGSGFYDPQNNSWHVIPRMPKKRIGAAICTINSCIYVIGGYNNGVSCKSVMRYCIKTQVWSLVADMNSPRSYSGVVAMNGLIYVFGGKSDDESNSRSFEEYNIYKNEWVISDVFMDTDRFHIDVIIFDKNSLLFQSIFRDIPIGLVC